MSSKPRHSSTGSVGSLASAAAVWLAVSALSGCTGADDDAGATGATDAAGAGEEWTTLFDGSSLEGWDIVGDADWQLEDGAVRAAAGSGHLVSAASYGDFELELEFWVTDDANSGVFIRCRDTTAINTENCYEVNIFDQRPDQTYRTGSIVDVAPPQVSIDTGGRWNTFRITALGPRLSIELNETPTVDVEDGRLTEGPFTLQYGAGTVMFRNVRIRSL